MPLCRTRRWFPDEPADRPDDFDLAEAWKDVVRDVNQQRESASTIVVPNTAIVPFLREQFGELAVADTAIDDHRARVRISAPAEIMLTRGLAGRGEYVDVLEPASVRAELLRLGAALVERNGK